MWQLQVDFLVVSYLDYTEFVILVCLVLDYREP